MRILATKNHGQDKGMLAELQGQIERITYTNEDSGYPVSGSIRLLIEIEGFRHMGPEALLEKLKFARDHAKDIEKMAVVSDRVWIKSWLKIGGLFAHKEAEHFNRSEMEGAWKWLRQ